MAARGLPSTVQRGVLFDLDLTLVTYEPAVPGIVAATCAGLGLPADEATVSRFGERVRVRFAEFRGDPFVAAARDLVRDADWSVRPERFAARLKRTELDAMSVPAGVREGVAAVAADHPVGVVTNGYGPVQRRKVERAGLSQHVDAIVTPSEVRALKPDLALLRAGAGALSADRFVVVGDSVDGDLEPALALGFDAVLVGGRDDRALACLAGPSDLAALPRVLDGAPDVGRPEPG